MIRPGRLSMPTWLSGGDWSSSKCDGDDIIASFYLVSLVFFLLRVEQARRCEYVRTRPHLLSQSLSAFLDSSRDISRREVREAEDRGK